MVQKVGENAYKIKFMGDIQISSTFDVGDLTPYIKEEDEHNEYLRENPFQGEVDAE